MPVRTAGILSHTVHSEPYLHRIDTALPIESNTSRTCILKHSSSLNVNDKSRREKTVSDDPKSLSTEQIPPSTAEEPRDGHFNYPEINEAVTWNDSSAPNGGWGWLVVAGSFLCLLTVDGVCFSYGLLMRQAISDGQFNSETGYQNWTSVNGPSLAAFALPGGLFCGITLFCGPFVGALTNLFDYRPVAMCGALLVSLVCLLCGLVIDGIGWFTVTFGVFGGIGCSLVYLPAITVVGYWFDRYRALVVGLTMCGSGVGSALLAALLNHLAACSSWTDTLIAIACLFLQIMVGIALFRPLHVNELILLRQAARRSQLVPGKRADLQRTRKSLLKGLLRRYIKPSIPRGSIMARIIEEKSRQRTTSTGSLDGMVITRNNELVALPPEACEIAVAAATFYAGNELLSELKTSSLASGAADLPSATAKTRSQNLEPLLEEITLSPLCVPVNAVTAAQVVGAKVLPTSSKRIATAAAVRRIVLDIISKLQATSSLEAPPGWRWVSQRLPEFPHSLSGANQTAEFVQQLMPSGSLHGRGETEVVRSRTSLTLAGGAGRHFQKAYWLSDRHILEGFVNNRQKGSSGKWNSGLDSNLCPAAAVSLAPSRLESLVSLNSRSNQLIARELSLLPLDRAGKAAVMAALRVELSRPRYRPDLFYPGSIDSSGRGSVMVHRYRAGTRTPSIDQSQPVEVQAELDDVAASEAGRSQTERPEAQAKRSMQNAMHRSESYSHRTCRFRSIPSPEVRRTVPVVKQPEVTGTTVEDGPSNEFASYLRDMLDTRLLRRPAFLLMLLACSLNISVLLVPVHYLPLLLDLGGRECQKNLHWCPSGLPYNSLANQHGDGQGSLFTWLTDEFAFANRAATLQVIGLAGVIGRLAAAVYIQRGLNQGCRPPNTCRKLADPMFWNNSALLLCALSLAGVALAIHGLPVRAGRSSTQIDSPLVQLWSMETRVGLFFFSILTYGFANAVSISLRSVIMVELFGIHHLTNAFGYLLITQGVAAILGPPLFGYVCDWACHDQLLHYSHMDARQFGGTDCANQLIYVFYACAAIFLLSAFLFAPLRWVNRQTNRGYRHRSGYYHHHYPSVFEMSDTGSTPQWFARAFGSDSTLAAGGKGYDHQETQTTHILPDRSAF